MKKIIIVIVLTLSFSQAMSQQNTDTTFSRIIALDFNSFVGKPIDSLIFALPQGYVQMKVGTNHRFKQADRFIIRYQNNIRIEIKIDTFSHINPILIPGVHLDSAWDVQLCRKEIISCFRVCKDWDWIGCEF